MPESAWPWVLEQISSSPLQVEVLPSDPDNGPRCLEQLQVTDGSALGTLALNSGGLLVDNGWLRVLGGSVAPGIGLSEVNCFPTAVDPEWRPTDGLIVGYDVLGGMYAINLGGSDRPGEPGQILYFAPDTLEWDALPMSHSQWLAWLLSGDANQYYESLRWAGWDEETRSLTLDQGLAFYPFLWSQQATDDLAATNRRPVPFAELIGITADFTAQLGIPSPGFLGAY